MTIREIIEKGRKLEELSSSPYREYGMNGYILNSVDKIILSIPFAGGQADINFILHCANTHAALLEENARIKNMLATKEDLVQKCDAGHVWRTAYGPGCPFCRKLDTLTLALNVAVYRLGEYASGRCIYPAWAADTLANIANIREGK